MDLGLRRSKGKLRTPRLDRRNAARHIDYDASAHGYTTPGNADSPFTSSPSTTCESPGALRATRSLEINPALSNQTSFRIGGSFEGEVDDLCRNLGLSGPDEFAIPAALWEARKPRANSDLLPRSRLFHPNSHSTPLPTSSLVDVDAEPQLNETQQRESEVANEKGVVVNADQCGVQVVASSVLPQSKGNCEGGGIKGNRPPTLKMPQTCPVEVGNPGSLTPPPPSKLIAVDDGRTSSWEVIYSFGPKDEISLHEAEKNISDSEEDQEDVVEEDQDEVVEEDQAEEEKQEEQQAAETTVKEMQDVRTGETLQLISGTSPVNGKDKPSPNKQFSIKITSCIRGTLLGSGSFGKVYEAISEKGAFFAVKEVSLLDQGINAHQCILQLEQEVALLSQFEHENIVQYYCTDKDDENLYIFLELVTKGSLASLYQKYCLRETQVSSYTRQILNGLVYLHERNVVHRDIKCANILVHANGSVKLADFGLAKEISKFNMLKSCQGSVFWMAPEVVHPRKSYGRPADIWSLGCTVLEMLTQQIPYPNLEWANAFFLIGQGKQPPIPSSLSEKARDFISQCIQVNPDDRPTALQLLNHPFVNQPE